MTAAGRFATIGKQLLTNRKLALGMGLGGMALESNTVKDRAQQHPVAASLHAGLSRTVGLVNMINPGSIATQVGLGSLNAAVKHNRGDNTGSSFDGISSLLKTGASAGPGLLRPVFKGADTVLDRVNKVNTHSEDFLPHLPPSMAESLTDFQHGVAGVNDLAHQKVTNATEHAKYLNSTEYAQKQRRDELRGLRSGKAVNR